MGRHSGNNGVVRVGSNAIGGLVGWDISETAGTIDTTAIGDLAKEKVADIPEWKGSIKMNADYDAGANQTLRAGDTIAFEGYSEGNTTGKTYYSGQAIVTSNGKDVPFGGVVTRQYDFEGTGVLTVAVVA